MNTEEQTGMPLRAFTYSERATQMPALVAAVDGAGGWILDRRAVSADALLVQIEVQTAALVDVYSALLACGLELTRDSHRALTERCTCSMHGTPMRSSLSVLSLRLEVHFLPTPTQPADIVRMIPLGAASA